MLADLKQINRVVGPTDEVKGSFECVVNDNYCIATAVLERTVVVIDESNGTKVLVPKDLVWVDPAHIEPLVTRRSQKEKARGNHEETLNRKGNPGWGWNGGSTNGS